MIKSSSINQSYTMIGELYGNIGLLDCLRVIEMKNFNEIQLPFFSFPQNTKDKQSLNTLGLKESCSYS